MAKRVEFPIRTKLLLLISGLILAATGAYLAIAVKLFRDDKTTLVYELDLGTVKTLSAQTEAMLGKVLDKVKLLTQGHTDAAWTRGVFEAEPDLVSFALYEPEGDGWKVATSVRNDQYLKLYGLGAAEVDRIRQAIPVPFAKVLATRTWAANATLPGGAPILSVALALGVAGASGTGSTAAQERIAVVDLRLDRLLKLVSERGIATVFVVDGEGGVIAHPDLSLVTGRASVRESPIVREAIESLVGGQIKAFDWKGERWLGAHAGVGIGGIRVVSQVREAEAFRAARQLIEKSVLFALIVITAGLLVSGWVGRGLTEPVEQLLDATEKLERGEQGISIHVKTRDEIAMLARAFNSMASNLTAQRAELQSSHAELEIKVRERTEALESQKKYLAESQDALLRTTRLASLGELAGAAAHEVLNPINNINIRVERVRTLLKERENGDVALLNEILFEWKKKFDQGGWEALEADLRKPAKEGSRESLGEEDLKNLLGISKDLAAWLSDRNEDMDFFSKEISRVTRIVNSMRSLSRVGGKRGPLDIHAPIEDTSLTLGDLFKKRGIELVKDFSAEPRANLTILGDRDELVQVFSNILRNGIYAVDEARRRAPLIRISTRRQGSRIEVRIQDNGMGIKSEHLGRIFEPDFTTKSLEDGTGLGLSISRRLVRAFDGDLEVESTVEGEGTTFLVWFPASS